MLCEVYYKPTSYDYVDEIFCYSNENKEWGVD
jgi:hypothetical protein